MPGFKIADNQDKQLDPPDQAVYTYTWNISELVGRFPLADDRALIFLKNCTLPSYSYETESPKGPHVHYEFAKSVKWNDIKLTWYDVDNVVGVLINIGRQAWKSDKGIRPADDYMAPTEIQVYNFDGTMNYSWILANSWIKSINASDLTYDTSDIHNVSATVAYSWADFKKTKTQ